MPHGVLFRGNVEAEIRQKLIRQGVIKGIIGLPANLFYGTGIPACIIVIDKQNATARKAIFMMDASKGFIKDGNKNRLREQDIHKIVDIFNKQIEEIGYSRRVSFNEIEKNEYNLNIPRYIDSSEAEDIHDLHAHLYGGIPNADIDALQNYWDVFPSLRQSLFTANVHEGYSDARVAGSELKATIIANAEYQDFKQQSIQLFDEWKQQHKATLTKLKVGDNPKALIVQLSEDLLSRFANTKLISKYNIYQILMDYWNETMQDDIYIITQDGWQAGNVIREIMPVKDKNKKNVYKEAHDFEFGTAKNKKRYKSDLIPPQLVINRFFAEEQNTLDVLQQQQEQATQALESYIEEHSSSGSDSEEEGLIEEAKNNNGKVSQKSLKDRLKESNDTDETKVLEDCLTLLATEAKAKKAVKEAQAALKKQVFEKIPQLTIEEIKTLVIEDKWNASLHTEIQAEIERVTQQLAKRLKTLNERYKTPLPDLADEVDRLSGKVDEHLRAMGVLV